jgi:hypothetical protein
MLLCSPAIEEKEKQLLYAHLKTYGKNVLGVFINFTKCSAMSCWRGSLFTLCIFVKHSVSARQSAFIKG